MDLRTKICIWVIVIGLANFLAYTVSYSILQGEAIHGDVSWDAASSQVVYKLNSDRAVSRGEFVYSGIHSISIWLTVMAVMLAMLTLAKDRISDSMHEAMMRGRTFCTVMAVLIAISMSGLTFIFIGQFSDLLKQADEMTANGGPVITQPSQPSEPAAGGSLHIQMAENTPAPRS